MAHAINASTLAALQTGAIIDRGMILFDFASGFYGFWTGVGVFTHNAIDYVGAGRLIEIDALTQVSSGEAVPVVVKLNTIPNSDLTPDVLATLESEAYHQRPVVISTAYFAAADNALLSVETEYRGYVDRIEHRERVAGESVALIYLESKARDHSKSGYRMRSDTDQRLISATDAFYEHASEAGTVTVNWGRRDPEPVS